MALVLVTPEELRKHVKADSGQETDLLKIYLDAAHEQIQRMANRTIFGTAEELASAVADWPAKMDEAYTQHEASVRAAMAIPDPIRQSGALDTAATVLRLLTDAQIADTNGMVATPDMKSAVLLIAGHLYRTREEVVTGQGAAAIQVPFAAQNIMARYRYAGPL